MGQFVGLIRSRGATDPQEGFVFNWDIPVVVAHSQLKIILMGVKLSVLLLLFSYFYSELIGNKQFRSENYITQTSSC